jgi:prevent-host-death family protein
MRSVGVRELRQHASRYLREVEQGESLQVTDRGRPIAMLVPIAGDVSGLEALRRAGRVRPGRGRLEDLGPPLPLPAGMPSPSEVLAAMRADER